jgi:uncharacterized repeat protein (TIGR01451 family)
MSIARHLLAMLALAGAAPALAATTCDNSNLYSFDFGSQATTQLAYGSTYSYTATNGAAATRSFSVNFTQNGLSSTSAGGFVMPRIDNSVLMTPANGRVLTIGGTFSARTPSITGSTRVITTTFTFAVPVRELSILAHDIDFASNQFRDWLYISGSDGTSTFTDPVLTLNASPTLRVGPGGTPSLLANEAMGTGANANNAANGNISILFNQPVTSVTLRYGNYPLGTGEAVTGQQAMGISTLSFCPVPNVAVTKSSTPYDTTGTTRFAVPGADMIYALTVTNSGGSTVDVNSLVLTDVLPANVTFYNGDFNSGSPGMGPFDVIAGTSTVTLPSAGRAYSNTGGATYVYAPAAGYDPAVNAIRLTPSGTMAANSSFTIRFRARVK